MNSNSCAKVWQQLEHTYNQGADQIWVFNVGDIKPIEIPLTFAMEMAWNVDSIKADTIPQFLGSIATDYLLETKETSGRKCLNKIQWPILENICVN